MIRQKWRLEGLNNSLITVNTKILILVTLLAYILLGNQINPITVFVSLTMTNIIRGIMTNFLPAAITGLYEIQVSIQRLQVLESTIK